MQTRRPHASLAEDSIHLEYKVASLSNLAFSVSKEHSAFIFRDLKAVCVEVRNRRRIQEERSPEVQGHRKRWTGFETAIT